jgi:hypothetical protein
MTRTYEYLSNGIIITHIAGVSGKYESLSVEEQIDGLKKIFRTTVDTKIRKQTLDRLGDFDERAIPVINELISLTVDHDVKSHGLEIIGRLKSKTKSESFGLLIEDELASDDD